MKLHYEKVKEMSLALQQKEDARADLMQRIQGTATSATMSIPDPFQLEVSKHIVYASAIVYCSVLYCVASIIYKVY